MHTKFEVEVRRPRWEYVIGDMENMGACRDVMDRLRWKGRLMGEWLTHIHLKKQTVKKSCFNSDQILTLNKDYDGCWMCMIQSF